MAHRQHVPFGRVFNVPHASVRDHQPERAFLLALFQKSLPKLRNHRFGAGLDKIIQLAADDLFPGKPKSLPAPMLASR